VGTVRQQYRAMTAASSAEGVANVRYVARNTRVYSESTPLSSQPHESPTPHQTQRQTDRERGRDSVCMCVRTVLYVRMYVCMCV
jgi:hypothetical protein